MRWSSLLFALAMPAMQVLAAGHEGAVLEYRMKVRMRDEGAWSETGVHVTLSRADDMWSVSLYGENIFNNRHLTQVTPLSSFPYGSLNDPAIFGMRGSVNF